jgi:hypothetical protein
LKGLFSNPLIFQEAGSHRICKELIEVLKETFPASWTFPVAGTEIGEEIENDEIFQLYIYPFTQGFGLVPENFSMEDFSSPPGNGKMGPDLHHCLFYIAGIFFPIRPIQSEGESSGGQRGYFLPRRVSTGFERQGNLELVLHDPVRHQ